MRELRLISAFTNSVRLAPLRSAHFDSKMSRSIIPIVTAILAASIARAEVDNLKIVTDASPDYSDLPSLVHSVTSKWETPEEKCWAMFYWNHLRAGRRTR